MSLFESQIDIRTRFDAEGAAKAYDELAASVSDSRYGGVFEAEDAESAYDAASICLRYCGVEPGPVPEGVEDLEERIERACRPTGTMHRSLRLTGRWYRRAFGAMLAKLDTGEAIALLPSGATGYKYYDPSTGKKVKVNARVARHIEESAVIFYPPLPAKPLGVGDLVSYIIRIFDRSDYLLVLMATLVVTAIGLIPAWANKIAFGTVVPSHRSELILPLAGLLLGVTVSTALINACRNLIMARVSTKIDVLTSAAAFARLLALPTSFFKEYASGDLGTRVSVITQLSLMLATVLLGSVLSMLLSLVYIIQIAGYAPALAVPAFVVIVVQTSLTIMATLITMRYERTAMERSAKLSGTVTALLSGIQKIKLAGAEERAFTRWARGYAGYARAQYNRPPLLRALPAIVTLISLLGTIVFYYIAGSTNISVDSYMAFNVAFGQVSAAIMSLATAAGEIAQIRPMFEMVEPILAAVPEISEEKPNVESLTGDIEVSDLSFRYSETSPYVLNKLSFKIRRGEYVAIVGQSGCGKSTIMRLLLGFETPDKGSIYYGPLDAEKVNLRSLRQHIGVVLQDGKLFMGDLASNITISSPLATLDDAWEAAEIAGMADDIRKMPMGMQTFVTEGGGGISGGQRQRIMIARAVCGKRRILMLDEATSALDNRTQKHVSDALAKLDCTRVVIAHRLSTVRSCDRILLIEDGRVAEEGSYDELVALKGRFAALIERQRLEGEDSE